MIYYSVNYLIPKYEYLKALLCEPICVHCIQSLSWKKYMHPLKFVIKCMPPDNQHSFPSQWVLNEECSLIR